MKSSASLSLVQYPHLLHGHVSIAAILFIAIRKIKNIFRSEITLQTVKHFRSDNMGLTAGKVPDVFQLADSFWRNDTKERPQWWFF